MGKKFKNIFAKKRRKLLRIKKQFLPLRKIFNDQMT
jgi:hypothetical protein